MAVQFTGIVRDSRWTAWKALHAIKGGHVQHHADGTLLKVWFHDDYETHVCEMWCGEVPDGVILGGYSQSQNDADKAEFQSKYEAKSNARLTSRTSDQKLLVSLWPTEGSRKTFISHNWADRTTWHGNSVRVTNETPSTVTPLLVYEVEENNLIDVKHGKLSGEDSLTSYRVVVQVSTDEGTTWVTKTEEDPHFAEVTEGNHGDYEVNYDTGTVSFHAELAAGAQVRVSYSHAALSARSSIFVVAPTPGKVLKLRKAEVQFTKDVILRDSITFETYGYVDVFAPHLLNTASPPGPFPSGTKIPLTSTTYKTMQDFYNEANGSLPTYPAIGGGGWRGSHHDVVVLQWDYAAMLSISYQAGMEVRIYLDHDCAFGGTYATATLYALSEAEA